MKNISDSSAPNARGGKQKAARPAGKPATRLDKPGNNANAARAAKRAEKDKSAKPDPRPATVVQKRDFLGRVAEATGISRAQLRPAVEATLAQLGQAIAAGETLALPPFGRARVTRQHDTKGGEVIVVKLRRATTDSEA